MTTIDNIDNKKDKKDNKTRVYCECGKSLADRHSLCKHRKICKYLNPPPQPAQPIDMMDFMKQQSHQMIIKRHQISPKYIYKLIFLFEFKP